MVSASMRTQASPLDEVISGAKLEAVDVWISESSRPVLLFVVIGILEAAKVDAGRVGESSLAGVVFSLEGPLNDELPQENKPAEGTKQTNRKPGVKSGMQFLQTREKSAKDKASSDVQSKNTYYGLFLSCQGRQKHFKAV